MSIFSRLQIVALALGVIILIYAVYQSSGSAEAAVINQDPAAAQFIFLGDYVASGVGRFLLYQQPAPTASFPEYGYIPVKRNAWGQWRIGTGGPCSSPNPQPMTSTVDFHVHYLPSIYSDNESTAYSVVCGRVHTIQAHTAAVQWEDGTVTRSLVKQEWFLILKPARQAACQLQLLDNTETVIQTIELAQVDFPSTATTTPLPPCTK